MSHAYLIYGSLESGKKVLFAEMEKRGIVIAPADLWIHAVDGGTIDDVRLMRTEAYQKPIAGTYRLAVLSASTLHEEAQQALLKSFEEPGDAVIVALIVPLGTPILATVLSRVQTVYADDEDSALPFTVQTFVSASQKERLVLLEDILDKENESDPSTGAQGKKSQVIMLVDAIESYFVSRVKSGDKAVILALADIEHMRPFLFQKGGSVKQVMEYLAIALPGDGSTKS